MLTSPTQKQAMHCDYALGAFEAVYFLLQRSLVTCSSDRASTGFGPGNTLKSDIPGLLNCHNKFVNAAIGDTLCTLNLK